jgi:hypothetical protein
LAVFVKGLIEFFEQLTQAVVVSFIESGSF